MGRGWVLGEGEGGYNSESSHEKKCPKIGSALSQSYCSAPAPILVIDESICIV